MFEDKKIKVAQILLNHRDLENSENRAKTLELLQSFGPNQIPIINANDSNSHEELHGTKFSDNDELASLVAQ
jgi:glutamate 5-kinase